MGGDRRYIEIILKDIHLTRRGILVSISLWCTIPLDSAPHLFYRQSSCCNRSVLNVRAVMMRYSLQSSTTFWRDAATLCIFMKSYHQVLVMYRKYHFLDASTNGYNQVSYTRLVNNQRSHFISSLVKLKLHR